MNWLVFAIVTYVALVLETGLRTLLAIPDANGVSPSFLLVVGVYVGLMAPASVVPWAMLVLGILTDVQGGPVGDMVILGPAALGYLLGGYALLQFRMLVFPDSVITLAAMVFTVGIFVQLVIVLIYTARGVSWLTAEPVPGWVAADQLVHRFLELVYTAAVALPVGALLFRLHPIWGFAARERHH